MNNNWCKCRCTLSSSRTAYKFVTSRHSPPLFRVRHQGAFRNLAGGERSLSTLKNILAEKIPGKQADLLKLKKEHGHKSVGEVSRCNTVCHLVSPYGQSWAGWALPCRAVCYQVCKLTPAAGFHDAIAKSAHAWRRMHGPIGPILAWLPSLAVNSGCHRLSFS